MIEVSSYVALTVHGVNEMKCVPLIPQWTHNRQCRHQGVLGEYAKLDEPSEKSGWTEASGDILQRGHDQISGIKYLFVYVSGINTPIIVRIHPSLAVLCFCVSQVSAAGIQSTPLNLAVSWRGDAMNTDLRIDYKYNTEAMAAPVPLHDIQFLVPVDGGEAKLQAMIPPATW